MMIRRAIALGLACVVGVGASARQDKEAEGRPKYRETTVQKLRAAPKEYRNREVTYTGRLSGFSATFFPYMEASGFRADEAYGLIVGHPAVPVIAPKKGKFKTLMSEIKPGVKVRVRGRLKRFSKKPAQTLLPRYYVSLEVLDTPSLLDLIRAKQSQSRKDDAQPAAE